jgi:hypothetical protein
MASADPSRRVEKVVAYPPLISVKTHRASHLAHRASHFPQTGQANAAAARLPLPGLGRGAAGVGDVPGEQGPQVHPSARRRTLDQTFGDEGFDTSGGAAPPCRTHTARRTPAALETTRPPGRARRGPGTSRTAGQQPPGRPEPARAASLAPSTARGRAEDAPLRARFELLAAVQAPHRRRARRLSHRNSPRARPRAFLVCRPTRRSVRRQSTLAHPPLAPRTPCWTVALTGYDNVTGTEAWRTPCASWY